MGLIKRLQSEFYMRDVLIVAPELVGKRLVLRSGGKNLKKYLITETEAYRGIEDRACHASRGRTVRNEIMFGTGGKIYVYFVYGMFWMLNVVTGGVNDPQAALIRGIEGFDGPGKLTKALGIDKSYYGEDLTTSGRIWIEATDFLPEVKTGKRIGIEYSGEPWKSKPWRYYV